MKEKYEEILNNTIFQEQNRIIKSNNMINNVITIEIDYLTNQIIWASKDVSSMFGIDIEEKNLTMKHIFDLITEADKIELKSKFKLLEKNDSKIDHLFVIKKNNDKNTRHIYLNAEIKKNQYDKPSSIILVLTDITNHKKLSVQNKITEYMFSALYDNSPFGICLGDTKTGMIYKANKKYQDILSINFDDNKNIDWASITHPDDIEEDLIYMEKMNKGEINGFTIEKRYIRPNGSEVWVNMSIISILVDDQSMNKYLCIIEDITDKKSQIMNIKFALEHDLLTGLYNRTYINQEYKRLKSSGTYPISIILGNIDGIKAYNEVFGYQHGDQEIIRIGNKIKEFLNIHGKLARAGGDEFIVILTGYDEESIREFTINLTDYVNYSDQNLKKEALSISFGFAIQNSSDDSLDDLYKEAEVFLYSKKYYNKKSTRSNTINLIMNTLFEKSERERNHSHRVGEISSKIARLMNFDEEKVDKVRVAGYLHDIGKIGIDESILNKSDKLTETEWETIKQHTLKGARILKRSNEYKHIYNIVLSHHERYDGTGYPNGISGENIPIEARIITLADAYDAMTKYRPYKETMKHQDALKEIEKCSGTHFDPEVVNVFISNF